MAITTYAPQIQVTLKKNIGRSAVAGSVPVSKRYSGTKRTIDLTPWLGDGSSVIVDKSTRSPSGMFSISIPDKPSDDQPESLYGLIEPMDVIEIAMARDASQYPGGTLPIMMRGFVRRLRRRELMGDDGRPRRFIEIEGRDYGCILELDQVVYLPNGVTGQNLLTYFKLFENYGVGSKSNEDASDFVTEVMDKVISKFLASMRADSGQGANSPVLDIGVDAIVHSGVVSPFGTQQWPGGTIYNLLAYYGDVGPWNELYVEDRADKPYLVYRPNPFRDAATGRYIQEPYKSNPSSAPKSIRVSDKSVQELNVERDDSHVFNYFWVDNPSYSLVGSPLLQIAEGATDKDSIFISNYPNNDPALYGFRPLNTVSMQGPRYDGAPAVDMGKGNSSAVAFMDERRQLLIDQNRDNIVFESGSMRLRGDESLRAGLYVQLDRGTDWTTTGNFIQTMYAYGVRHAYVPYRSYTTEVFFDRGTGFIERAQRSNGLGNPYWSEASAGGVYNK